MPTHESTSNEMRSSEKNAMLSRASTTTETRSIAPTTVSVTATTWTWTRNSWRCYVDPETEWPRGCAYRADCSPPPTSATHHRGLQTSELVEG